MTDQNQLPPCLGPAGENIPQCCPEADDLSDCDKWAFESGLRVFDHLRFRIGSAIGSFRIADWYESLGRFGLHCPAIEIEGRRFGPHDLNEEQRADLVRLSVERRQYTRELITRNIGAVAISCIETNASTSAKNSLIVAWNLMERFYDIFEILYQASVSSQLREQYPSARFSAIPDLACIMKWKIQTSPSWCPSGDEFIQGEILQ